MKKISEMDIDELRDYALKLEGDVAEGVKREGELSEEISALTKRNQTLQDRNNALFVQVEQSRTPAAPTTPEPPKVVSCEEYARSIADKI